MGYFMLITGPGTEYVLSEFNHSCCSYSYLNAIRITTLHLDFIPKLLPQWGRPAFTFPWNAGKSETFDSWLGFWVYKVRISHGLVHDLRTFTLSHLPREAWIQPANFPAPTCALGEGLNFQSLAKVSLQWTAFGTTPLGSEGKKVCERPGKAVSAAVLFSQAAFSQDTHPLLFPACAFTFKQYECPFPQETENLSEHCAAPPTPTPALGACWDAWPLAEVIQWIYSLICCNCSIHPARNGFSWVLDVHFGGIYLLAFTIAGQLTYTMCFLSSGLLLRKISPAFVLFIFRLQIYTLFPQNSLLSPVTFRHSFFFSNMYLPCDAPNSGRQVLFPRLSLLLESDLHLPQGLCSLFMVVTLGPGQK